MTRRTLADDLSAHLVFGTGTSATLAALTRKRVSRDLVERVR